VHISQIVAGGEPEKGERCVFDVADNPRSGKPQAVNVYLGG
jgi:cold shock CspA family protein